MLILAESCTPMSSVEQPPLSGAQVTRDDGLDSTTEPRDFPRRGNPSNTERDNDQPQELSSTNAGVASASLSPENGSQNGQVNETGANPLQASSSDDPWSRKTLLTLDGGGVRGYSSLLILRALMEEIRVIEQREDLNATHSAYPLNKRYRGLTPQQTGNGRLQPINFTEDASSYPYIPSHYFDYVAGTSTGGLIGIMLGRLSMTVQECLEAYEQFADTVFGHPRRFHVRQPPFIPPRPKYRSKPLSDVIKDIIRQKGPSGLTRLSFEQPQKDMCRTIVVAWQEITLSRIRVPYLFRSYLHPKSIPDNPLERNADTDIYYQILEVGLATTAAPSYFKSVKLVEGDDRYEFIDGGFGANNPSEEAIRSVKQLFGNNLESIRLLVSIGTGKNQEAATKPRTGYRKYFHYLNSAARWATDSEHIHHSVYETLNGKVDYHRLNVEHGLGKMKLDAWKGERGRETLDLIRSKTRDYLATPAARDSLRGSAERLVAIRRARAHCQDQDRWERFCHGVEYRCDRSSCPRGDRLFTRQDFESHLKQSHPESCSEDELERILDNGKRFQLFPLDRPPPDSH